MTHEKIMTENFIQIRTAVDAIKKIIPEDWEDFVESMEVGRTLLLLAENIRKNDATDADLWGEVVHTINTIAAGTDDFNRPGANPGKGSRKMEPIKFELVETNCLARFSCDVCGGMTDKNPIVCEVKTGDFAGMRVCEGCLMDGDLDQKISSRIDGLTKQAEALRAALGRMQAPTFEEWRAACTAWDKAYEAEVCGGIQPTTGTGYKFAFLEAMAPD